LPRVFGCKLTAQLSLLVPLLLSATVLQLQEALHAGPGHRLFGLESPGIHRLHNINSLLPLVAHHSRPIRKAPSSLPGADGALERLCVCRSCLRALPHNIFTILPFGLGLRCQLETKAKPRGAGHHMRLRRRRALRGDLGALQPCRKWHPAALGVD
jgi:hypothetical protein